MIQDLGLKVPSQVISNGINLNEFKKIKTDKKIYDTFHLNKRIPIFLFVGRLEKDKNIDIVLKAIHINKNKLAFQMVIAGKGRDETALKELAKELKLDDKVTFTGQVSDQDLKQLYTIAKVCIGSGSAELQGLAVMEAMAHGLPILAANAVALPELVKNGINGYLFELSPQSLAKSMMKILKSKNTLKKMAYQSLKIIKNHSKENTTKSFTKLYGKILGH
jgi:glycosyltransferase involved in cell wall biosynthesis